MPSKPLIWLGPDRPQHLVDAILSAGGELAEPNQANAIVWSSDTVPIEEIVSLLSPAVRWVQLDSAGVDHWLEAGVLDTDRTWTGAQGVYASRVAEHVLAFILAAAKNLPALMRQTRWSNVETQVLEGKTVGFLGGGGIVQEAIRRLTPFGVTSLALTRSGRPIAGAERSLEPTQLSDLLHESDFLVLAAPLTQATDRLIRANELARMKPHAWLINVARGRLVDTEDLVHALNTKRIAGACLDVTYPEPLPPSSPLWRLDNVLITPHVANPWRDHLEPLARRVTDNVRRFATRDELLGVIDVEAGY